MNEEEFEVIVVGGGLGGLTAAAWLAKAGCRVLLLEKEPQVGGYFGPVSIGPYRFNNGPHSLMSCNPDGPYGPGVTYRLLDALGVAGQCGFIPLQPFTAVRIPGLEFQLQSGRQAFIDSLKAVDPHGFENLPALLDLYGRIHRAGLAYFQASTPREVIKAAAQLAPVAPYQFATAENVLKRFLPQERARSLAFVLWSYLGQPPWHASFIIWAAMMAAYIDDGGWFCKGGLHQLSLAVLGAFQRDGGVLLAGTAVERILVQDRRVRGVELAGGRRCFAPAVIAAIDPRQALGPLLEPEQRPAAYLRRLGKLGLSVRGVNLSLVTDLDLPALGFGYDTLVLEGWDHRQTWQRLEAGESAMFSLTMMDAADPSMTPAGQHAVNLFGSLPMHSTITPETIGRIAERLLQAAERYAPGLSTHLLLKGSAEAPQGYRATAFEPIYGWAPTPANTALLRLGPQTPVHGLTLAGQWTRPGQGAPGVVLSGLAAARIVMKEKG